ncbi:MAG TPA: FecR domain-containing protein [Candidatus Angelobacter sp.]
MRDDYLWDGSGEPDPEIQKMENALGKLRHDRPAPEFPEFAGSAVPAPRRPFWQLRWPQFAVACAALLAVAAASLLWFRSRTEPFDPKTAWDVTRVEGAPQVGRHKIDVIQSTGKLGTGQVLETNNASRAVMRFEETGEIEVEPGTRIRLVKSNSGVKRLSLERGTIRATIWAPPGEFVVDTPSAVAVDLGCVYTLHVDDSGNGLLRTTLGWVGFKLGDRESFIPAGAVCATRKKTGPGIPYFEDASESFRSALATLDRPESSAGDHAAALRVVLAQARRRDAITLWHLLSRVDGAERERVYGRLAEMAPAPAGVTREGIMRLDRGMLDLWWNELGFDDISVWRHWERSWQQGK